VVRVPAEPVIAAVQVIGRAVQVALVVPEGPVVPAVRAALVVPENQVAPVGLAVQVAPVALANRVALEVVPVVAVPVLDQVEAQRRTRSATAVHHRVQVPVLAAEDLAAVVETTHEPAATEAVVAWAAVDTAAEAAVTAE
jgi:hypothetical protein